MPKNFSFTETFFLNVVIFNFFFLLTENDFLTLRVTFYSSRGRKSLLECMVHEFSWTEKLLCNYSCVQCCQGGTAKTAAALACYYFFVCPCDVVRVVRGRLINSQLTRHCVPGGGGELNRLPEASDCLCMSTVKEETDGRVVWTVER